MGNIVEILPGEEVARGALHPYTKALLQSVFDLHMDFNKPITPLEEKLLCRQENYKAVHFRTVVRSAWKNVKRKTRIKNIR